MPDVTPDWLAHVVERGLAHAADCGFEEVEVEVDRAGDQMRKVLFGRDFTIKEECVVEAWITADALPEVSPLPEGYRLSNRAENMQRPRHRVG